MTSNVNATSFESIFDSTIFQTPYNAFMCGLNETRNRGLYNATVWGFSKVSDAINYGVNETRNRGFYMPYNAAVWGFSKASNAINYGVGPTIGKVGEAVKFAFNEENHQATSCLISTGAFAYMTFKGALMVFDPLKFEWIEFDYRFKSKFELKAKLVNISELVNKVLPDALPGNTQAKTIAGVTAEAAAANAKTVAALAVQTAAQAKINSDQAEMNAVQAKTNSDQTAAVQAKRNSDQAEAEAVQAETDSNQAELDAVQAETNSHQAGVNVAQAQRNSEQAEAEAIQAEREAYTAQRERDNVRGQPKEADKKRIARQKLTVSNLARADATRLKVISDAAPGIAVQRLNEANLARAAATRLKVISDAARAEATRLKQISDEAPATATRLKEISDAARAEATRLKQISDAAELVVQREQEKALKANTAAVEAKKQVDSAKEKTQTLKKNENTNIPEGNHLISYNVEKTKIKAGEYHLPLPMSNNAVIFKWDAFKKSIKTSFAGMPTFTWGVLGTIDSFSKFDAASRASFVEAINSESVDPTIVNALATIKPIPQTLSNKLLGNSRETIAHVLGTPVQWTVGVLGNTAAWVASSDTYGLSKLTAAAALGYGGFRLFSGGWGGYVKPLDGVWYEIKKAKPNETILTSSRYALNTGVIFRDVAKFATGTAMIGAAILSANDFFSGNDYGS